MILQSLYSYYQRLSEDEHSGVAPEGFAPQKISFALDIAPDGTLIGLADLRNKAEKGGKWLPCIMEVPSLGKKRAVDITPNFLWDGAGYVLGADDKGKPERTAQCHAAFKELHHTLLSGCHSPAIKTVLAFLQRWIPAKATELAPWQDIAGGNLVFRVQNKFLHMLPETQEIWTRRYLDATGPTGICLVTGETVPIATLHPAIKGVAGAQSSGASLSSYNLSAFASYGKTQNQNAPVGKYAAFAYATALNYLLTREQQRLRYGESTVLCWAERACPLEDTIFSLIAGPQSRPDKEADIAAAQERAKTLRRIGQGHYQEIWPDLDPNVDMHILALAPNASRLSVSFHLRGTAREFLKRITAYYKEMAVARRFDTEPEFPSVWQIARALLGKHKKTQDIKRLGEDILRAILSGGLLPACLLPLCLERLRAGEDANSVRAGIIKAQLIRNYNHEVPMSLNPDHPSPAYHLGRLFALLLGLQKKAIPAINADIRDRFYGSASATPAVVFPILLRNAQNHISKTSAYGYDKLIKETLSRLDDAFPSHLNLVQQGEFALGYYHQRATRAVETDVESATAAVE